MNSISQAAHTSHEYVYGSLSKNYQSFKSGIKNFNFKENIISQTIKVALHALATISLIIPFIFTYPSSTFVSCFEGKGDYLQRTLSNIGKLNITGQTAHRHSMEFTPVSIPNDNDKPIEMGNISNKGDLTRAVSDFDAEYGED